VLLGIGGQSSPRFARQAIAGGRPARRCGPSATAPAAVPCRVRAAP